MAEQSCATLLELALTLSDLDQCFEIRTPLAPVTLWLVPDERDAMTLAHDGIARGRVWTRAEVLTVWALPESARGLATVVSAKLAVDGNVTAAVASECPCLPDQPHSPFCRRAPDYVARAERDRKRLGASPEIQREITVPW